MKGNIVNPPQAGAQSSNASLKWDDSRMPWPEEYFRVQPSDVVKRLYAESTKVTPAGRLSEAE